MNFTVERFFFVEPHIMLTNDRISCHRYDLRTQSKGPTRIYRRKNSTLTEGQHYFVSLMRFFSFTRFGIR